MTQSTFRTRVLLNVLLAFSVSSIRCNKNTGGQPGSSDKPGAAGKALSESEPRTATRGDQRAGLEVPNPDLSDVCAADGKRAGIASGVCPRYAGNWEWDESAALIPTTPEQSNLPPCSMEDRDLASLSAPGWRLEVERDLGVFPAGASADHFHSVFVVKRLDAAEPCSLRLMWKLKQHALKLPVGSELHYKSALHLRGVEDDVSATSVLRDQKGQLLIGHASGMRPDVWDREVWPELALSVDQSAICADAQRSTVELLRFTIAAGRDTCTLDARSARCCSMLGDTYVVKASDAVRNSAKSVRVGERNVPQDSVNLIVAKKSLLAPAR